MFSILPEFHLLFFQPQFLLVLPEPIDPDIAVGNQWDEAVAENCHRQSGQ